jgi:hypothetical protein
VEITPTPTAEEAAAIVAAYEAFWPRPVAAPSAPIVTNSPWRFSGRWWLSNPRQRLRP